MPVERMKIGDIVRFKYNPRSYGVIKGIVEKENVLEYIVDWFGYHHTLGEDSVVSINLEKVLSA